MTCNVKKYTHCKEKTYKKQLLCIYESRRKFDTKTFIDWGYYKLEGNKKLQSSLITKCTGVRIYNFRHKVTYIHL